MDIGGILALLKKNFDANKALAKSCIQIFPLNFYERNWNFELEKAIKECNIILAADGKSLFLIFIMRVDPPPP